MTLNKVVVMQIRVDIDSTSCFKRAPSSALVEVLWMVAVHFRGQPPSFNHDS